MKTPDSVFDLHNDIEAVFISQLLLQEYLEGVLDVELVVGVHPRHVQKNLHPVWRQTERLRHTNTLQITGSSRPNITPALMDFHNS